MTSQIEFKKRKFIPENRKNKSIFATSKIKVKKKDCSKAKKKKKMERRCHDSY